MGTPGLEPGFSVMSTLALPPGGISPGGAPVVVQPHPGTMRVILMGLSRMLTTVMVPVFAVSAIISPSSSTPGSNLIAWRVSSGAVGTEPCG